VLDLARPVEREETPGGADDSGDGTGCEHIPEPLALRCGAEQLREDGQAHVTAEREGHGDEREPGEEAWKGEGDLVGEGGGVDEEDGADQPDDEGNEEHVVIGDDTGEVLDADAGHERDDAHGYKEEVDIGLRPAVSGQDVGGGDRFLDGEGEEVYDEEDEDDTETFGVGGGEDGRVRGGGGGGVDGVSRGEGGRRGRVEAEDDEEEDDYAEREDEPAGGRVRVEYETAVEVGRIDGGEEGTEGRTADESQDGEADMP